MGGFRSDETSCKPSRPTIMLSFSLDHTTDCHSIDDCCFLVM